MTVINYNKNFIFIHPRRTGGSSLVLSLLKFCNDKDKICDDVLNDHSDKWINKELKMKFKPSLSKKFNFSGFKTYLLSFIKIIPFINYVIKFNYPPNFSLKIPFFVNKPDLYSHTTVEEVKKLVPSNFFQSAFKFTIVRNPYDQFLSFFRASGTKKEFLDFTKKNACYFFNREIDNFYKDKSIYDKIIKFENLEKDLIDLSKLLNLNENIYDIFKTIKVNEFKPDVGEKKVDKNIIDVNSKNIIYNSAKKIFDEYGYKRELN